MDGCVPPPSAVALLLWRYLELLQLLALICFQMSWVLPLGITCGRLPRLNGQTTAQHTTLVLTGTLQLNS